MHAPLPYRRRRVRAIACACVIALLAAVVAGPAAAETPADREDWQVLFNGRDLGGWTPKITGYALGENFADTFRVEDGLLKVRYDGYESFDGRFGHLFYDKPFSYYRLVVEYRFVGEQTPGGPGDWALRNSGAMLHAQDPRTMRRDQDFPVSIEAQFLGGLGDGKPRPTLNLCTPGTDVVVRGALLRRHCLESSSATYDGERWVRVEVQVLGSGQITHLIDGKPVLEYALPQFGGDGVEHADPAMAPSGRLLDGGYIALQSESHPIDIRKVELLDLSGCMDPKADNYRTYFVKSEPGRCRYPKRDADGEP